MNEGTLELAARELSSVLEPVADALGATRASDALASLGLRFPDAVLAQASISGPLNAAQAVAGSMAARRAALDAAMSGGNPLAIVQAGAALLQTIANLFGALDAVGAAVGALPLASLPGIDAATLADFALHFRKRLLAHGAIGYMHSRVPTFSGVLALAGVLDNMPSPGAPGNPAKPGHMQRDIHLERLPDLLTNPAGSLRKLYGWGNPTFDAEALLNRIAALLGSLGLVARVDSPAPGQFALRSLFVDILPNLSTTPHRLDARLHGSVDDGASSTFAITPGWAVTVAAKGAFRAESELRISPPAELELVMPGGAFNGSIASTLRSTGAPFVLLGAAGATRLEVAACSIAAIFSFEARGATSEGQPHIVFKLDGGKAVIDASKGDPFLSFLTGGAKGDASFALAGDWTVANGLRVSSGAGLELSLPMHARLGPARLDRLYLRAGIAAAAIEVEISAAIGATLGPLDVSIDRIGLVARATFPETGGNLGPLNLAFDFKPPSGVGLSIDAGGFKGGGFLIFDLPKGEYAGGIELDFIGLVNVKAFGLLNTIFPDGHRGFSLVIIISAEFPPIQFGFGFTLIGVGGLLGLSRTVDTDAMREGMHQGALDSVLFPRDIVANAPRLISDLRRLFPPVEDHFLVGPMVKLGWGTPTIMSLEFGLILDIPRPAFVIIGRLRVGLPFQDLPLFDIRVTFAGGVDFESGQLWFDATLHDSRLLTFPLTGDMAVRLYWKENANFILTVGGFHPAYTPPPMGLGNLQRLGITIFDGQPRMRAETYFAITSNTVQFGAKAELMYGIDAFNIYGFIALDVLIQFDPFRFIATLSAMLAVRSGSAVFMGIRIDALLEGPQPWHAKGTGHFEISFIITISFDVDFEATIGESHRDALPPVDVLPLLAAAFGEPSNWRAVRPKGTNVQVTLRPFKAPDGAIVLHPFGSLELTEKLVPLNLPIARLGTRRIGDGSVYGVERVLLGGASGRIAPLREQFAPAQFIDMSDDAKLSSRSFERYEAGVQVGGGDAVNASHVKHLEVGYEVIYIPEHRKRIFFRLAEAVFNAFAGFGAVGRSPLSAAQSAPSVLGAKKATMTPEQFVVASTADLTLHDEWMVFASEAEARAAMRVAVDRDPQLMQTLQVIPSTLARASA